ncbi:probable phosphoglycerate mutase [Paramicrobacterium humi]|uniref:Probable phosphoglycerate mutase n=1 Tax=Paramicrobacterium humi TaxID=640635 RepID=A0A1H4R3M8_9MICO|nr:histidine phosphatase family protein [Microbacterium humi]SEC26334.1 probable phosphoglycerate mutase [Microbacterium humi]
MTEITFVRHGQTDWNLDRRIQGLTDIPLNDVGRAQALRSAGRLAAWRWDAIVSSPLVRALETAQIIATRLGLDDPRPVQGLEERAHGEMEGMTFEERQAAFPGAAPVPGLESRDDVIARVLAALRGLPDGDDGRRVLAVTHGGVIGSLLRHVTNGDLPAAGQIVANGSFHDFHLQGGELSLVEFRPMDADPELDRERVAPR